MMMMMMMVMTIGMAIDWIADNLYWTDEDRGYIMMSRLDGRHRTVLVTGLTRPKSVTVNPLTGSVLATAEVMFVPRFACGLVSMSAAEADSARPSPVG